MCESSRSRLEKHSAGNKTTFPQLNCLHVMAEALPQVGPWPLAAVPGVLEPPLLQPFPSHVSSSAGGDTSAPCCLAAWDQVLARASPRSDSEGVLFFFFFSFFLSTK